MFSLLQVTVLFCVTFLLLQHLTGEPSSTKGAPNYSFDSICWVLSCYSLQEKLKTRNKSKTFIALCFSWGGQSKQEQLHRVHVFQTWRRLRISNIKSPGSYSFRFAQAEKCYSCSTLSPVSLHCNSFVHFSNEGWVGVEEGQAAERQWPHQ